MWLSCVKGKLLLCYMDGEPEIYARNLLNHALEYAVL